MTKRTLAALCALLVAASTLAVVAQPAAAHSQTTTVQRCSYDPFAGQQCWTETVNVSHVHPCPAGMTGTYPNCYPPPPDNDGDDGNNDDEREKEAERKRKEAEAKRKAAEAERKRLEEEEKKDAESTDPCGDYAQDLIDALNKVNDGTDTPYDPPTRPEQCKGADWIRALKSKLKGLSKDVLRQLYDLELGTREVSDDVATALRQEIERLWDATPAEAQAAIVTVASGVGCAALIAAIVNTTVVSGGTAAPAWIAWIAAHKTAAEIVCTGAVSAAIVFVERVTGDETNAVPDDDDTDPSDEKNVNNAKDDDEDGADDEDGTDDEDAADEDSAGNYCGPWTASAWRPGRGAVTLFVNGAPYSEVQSSYGNREWAAARCQAVLASLRQ